MRIGMILDKTFPPDSRVENEAISLIEAGHEVFLFCLHYGDQEEKEVVNGIQVRRYKSNHLEYKLSALAYTLSAYHRLMAPKIADFLKKNDIRSVHIHDMTIAQAVFNVNRKLKLPVVLDLHENRPEIMRHYGHVNTLKGKLLISPDKWARKQKELIAKADKVILVTEEAKQEALKYDNKASEDITVVPNTVHPEVYSKYSIDQGIIERFKDNFIVLYLGDTGLRRGTDTAVEAMNILKESEPDIRLVMVGNNNAEDHKLKQLIKDLDCEDVVVLEGWQDVSLFPSYVKASDVCISPLKRNLHHDTTYANKIFQYMAMGKPVIVSDSTAQAKVITSENCGLVHEAENPGDLAEKIKQLKSDNELAEKLGLAGEKAVKERWNWTVTSSELINLYDQLK